MLNKVGITLSSEVYISDDLLYVLGFSKTICILNKIDFPHEDLSTILSMVGEVVETSKYNIEDMIIKAYYASYYMKIDKNGNNSCDKFNLKLDLCIDEIFNISEI